MVWRAPDKGGTYIPMLLLILALTLFGGTFVSAQSMQRLEGFGGYRFGMSIEQALRVRSDVTLTNCDYVGMAKCIERDAAFFGHSAKVVVQFAKENLRLVQIVLAFDRLKQTIKLPGEECTTVAQDLLNQLVKLYGSGKKEIGATTTWYFPKGAAISLGPLCIDRDKGYVTVSYYPTEGL